MSQTTDTDLGEELGLRERKKRATRSALHKAALRATLERGLAQVTVEEIAAEAEVSERTFFNYFSSKEEAVVGVDPTQADDLRRAMLARPADEPPLIALRAVLVGFAKKVTGEARQDWSDRFTAIKANPELIVAHMAAWSQLEHALADAIGQRTGLDPETSLYPRLAACTAADANRIAAMTWRSGSDRELPELVAEAIDLLVSGLRVPDTSGPHPTSD